MAPAHSIRTQHSPTRIVISPSQSLNHVSSRSCSQALRWRYIFSVVFQLTWRRKPCPKCFPWLVRILPFLEWCYTSAHKCFSAYLRLLFLLLGLYLDSLWLDKGSKSSSCKPCSACGKAWSCHCDMTFHSYYRWKENCELAPSGAPDHFCCNNTQMSFEPSGFIFPQVPDKFCSWGQDSTKCCTSLR